MRQAHLSYRQTEQSTDNSEEERADIGDVLYIQMELCANNTLRNCIDNGLYTDTKTVWRMFREILSGLAHIHKFKIIHRDLKPANIFLDSSNHVRIGDFGLAKELNVITDDQMEYSSEQNSLNKGESLTSYVGTSFYISPEIKAGTRYDQKADMYSLGVIFFEMCYRPIVTAMERNDILTSVCSSSICLPDDFNTFCEDNQFKIINLLLSHYPLTRPTAKDLLKSEQLLPLSEKPELSVIIHRTISNHNSQSYKILIDSLFSQPSPGFWDTNSLPYGSRSVVTYGDRRQSLFNIIETIFRKHNALKINIPLFLPKHSVHEGTRLRLYADGHEGRNFLSTA